ncbi:hypothetical protein CEUSTIGMA_g11297.t1 [Chlamydomonas eustigma]|uniref:Uncharacterized protein n=1 Tax=Chlamydomonas eustigma TaxID=1157962 RepID=A0A250XLV1_9CHLO|nr:hypothetical protein CEUSTIGMA_g11297.t1 [Chlamydomonas eustigma]|eukprot:GAX83872.1 hypothetical protein CEUSTIGMA_g11297.t1 [Chlamydomonas eustigma]
MTFETDSLAKSYEVDMLIESPKDYVMGGQMSIQNFLVALGDVLEAHHTTGPRKEEQSSVPSFQRFKAAHGTLITQCDMLLLKLSDKSTSRNGVPHSNGLVPADQQRMVTRHGAFPTSATAGNSHQEAGGLAYQEVGSRQYKEPQDIMVIDGETS